MKEKLKLYFQWFQDRIAEPSTWQGIGFILAITGSKMNGLDWGQGAAIGGLVSSFIKISTKG